MVQYHSFNFRIAETESILQRLEEDHESAGVVKCISCGNNSRGHLVVTSEPNLAQAQAISSLSPGRHLGSDYEQVLSVLNRQGGLKPLSRQSKPMTPMTRPVTVMSPNSKRDPKEPLYRRAQRVNAMKEVPKIPLVSFGPPSSVNDLFHMDDDTLSTNSSGSVKLPKVPAQLNSKSSASLQFNMH